MTPVKRHIKGFKITDRQILLHYNVDDAVLIAEREYSLKKLLYQFNTIAKNSKMNILATQTKCWIKNRTEKEVKFEYLGINVSE